MSPLLPKSAKAQPRTPRAVAIKPAKAKKAGFVFERRFKLLTGAVLAVLTILVGRAAFYSSMIGIFYATKAMPAPSGRAR